MLWDLESVEEVLKPDSDQHVSSSCNLSPEFQLVLKGSTTSIKVLCLDHLDERHTSLSSVGLDLYLKMLGQNV